MADFGRNGAIYQTKLLKEAEIPTGWMTLILVDGCVPTARMQEEHHLVFRGLWSPNVFFGHWSAEIFGYENIRKSGIRTQESGTLQRTLRRLQFNVTRVISRTLGSVWRCIDDVGLPTLYKPRPTYSTVLTTKLTDNERRRLDEKHVTLLDLILSPTMWSCISRKKLHSL